MPSHIAIAFAIAAASSAWGATWTVDVNGSGDFVDIQSAVDVASAGDEVIVLPGTYTSSDSQVVDLLGR